VQVNEYDTRRRLLYKRTLKTAAAAVCAVKQPEALRTIQPLPLDPYLHAQCCSVQQPSKRFTDSYIKTTAGQMSQQSAVVLLVLVIHCRVLSAPLVFPSL
jgi:hypothetical protein